MSTAEPKPAQLMIFTMSGMAVLPEASQSMARKSSPMPLSMELIGPRIENNVLKIIPMMDADKTVGNKNAVRNSEKPLISSYKSAAMTNGVMVQIGTPYSINLKLFSMDVMNSLSLNILRKLSKPIKLMLVMPSQDVKASTKTEMIGSSINAAINTIAGVENRIPHRCLIFVRRDTAGSLFIEITPLYSRSRRACQAKLCRVQDLRFTGGPVNRKLHAQPAGSVWRHYGLNAANWLRSHFWTGPFSCFHPRWRPR